MISDLLREYVSAVLAERDVSSFPIFKSNKQTEDRLFAAMKKLTDVTHVLCKGPESKDHCRVYLSDLKGKTDDDLKKIAKDAAELAFGGRPSVSNIGQAHSGRFDTYRVTDSDGEYTLNIVFSGGLTSGQRGGGYAYEGEIKRLLGSVGTQAEEIKSDTTLTDIFVKTNSGNLVGIEVKKGDSAKFGQPTLQYSYETNQFLVPPTSRSNKNAQLVADSLNSKEDPKLNLWLNNLKLAWDKLHPERKMQVLSTQIKSTDWKEMLKTPGVTQSGPAVPFELEQIVDYYAKKKAHYIQIQGKGLYSFNDVLDLGATPFIEASQNAFIKPEILLSGGNKVLRASITLNYLTLTKSNMDLTNSADVKKFSDALSSK